MSKATFVSEIPSNPTGNEVPTVELVQKMIETKINDFRTFEISMPNADTSDIYFILAPQTSGAYFKGTLMCDEETCFIDVHVLNQYAIGLFFNQISQYGNVSLVYITYNQEQYLALKIHIANITCLFKLHHFQSSNPELLQTITTNVSDEYNSVLVCPK